MVTHKTVLKEGTYIYIIIVSENKPIKIFNDVSYRHLQCLYVFKLRSDVDNKVAYMTCLCFDSSPYEVNTKVQGHVRC